MSRSFTTQKGTELPLLDMKGKDYLQCAHRLIWFREEKPEWGIKTEFLILTEDRAVAHATITNESGRVISTATKSETKDGFFDFIEKAETGAVGRALAYIGYGTQFCDLDEGVRIVDAPLLPKEKPIAALPLNDPSEYIVRFGKKYSGQSLKNIGYTDSENYLHWLEDNSEGKPLSGPALAFKNALLAWKKQRNSNGAVKT